MMPDFPKIKARCNTLVNRYIQRLIMSDGLLSQIKTYKEFEGDSMSVRPEGAKRSRRSSYDRTEASVTIPAKELIEKGLAAYLERLAPAARDMQRQQVQAIFKKLEQVTKETGNVVDNKGQPPSAEMFLSALEKIWIEFDDSGQPRLPSMIVSPQLAENLRNLMPQWDKDPEYKKRHDEIINKKRKEWNDRESNRKLVD